MLRRRRRGAPELPPRTADADARVDARLRATGEGATLDAAEWSGLNEALQGGKKGALTAMLARLGAGD